MCWFRYEYNVNKHCAHHSEHNWYEQVVYLRDRRHFCADFAATGNPCPIRECHQTPPVYHEIVRGFSCTTCVDEEIPWEVQSTVDIINWLRQFRNMPLATARLFQTEFYHWLWYACLKTPRAARNERKFYDYVSQWWTAKTTLHTKASVEEHLTAHIAEHGGMLPDQISERAISLFASGRYRDYVFIWPNYTVEPKDIPNYRDVGHHY